MAVPLDDESRVVIPKTVLSEIAKLTPHQSKLVQTELEKITAAEYTPAKLVYKQYGDLKVFRCGETLRLFGVILENIEAVDDFDHLVILLEISKHEYEQAGVTRQQAQEIQQTFSAIESEADFRAKLTGEILTEADIRSLFENSD